MAGRSLEGYEKEFENRPRRFILRFIAWLFIVGILFAGASYVFGWFSEAAVVVKEEFGPRASLEKYEWFKDCSETILEKQNTIEVYEINTTLMEADYKGVPHKDWDRIDKQQFNQWRAEITGIKASYNKVVKEYNAQSEKFNWDLYNTSDLPPSYDLYIDK